MPTRKQALDLLVRARDAFRFWALHPKPMRPGNSGTIQDIDAYLYAEDAPSRLEEYWKRER